MPTAKGKGGSVSHRYRPASEYDNATLAQKREYWRTKKREQRARLSEQRGRTKQGSRGEKLLHVNTRTVVNSSLSCSFGAPSSLSYHELDKTTNVAPASQSENIEEVGLFEATENRKEKWYHTVKLEKLLPQLPAPSSIATGSTSTAKCRTARGAVNSVVTSPTSSGTQLNTSSSVPPITVTRITNGSCAQTTHQPHVSVQDTKVKRKKQVELPGPPKSSLTNVSTGMKLESSLRDPVSVKTGVKTVNTTPQSGTKSALVNTHRAKGVGNSLPSMETNEEKAAKRRENWRIKKREQRAKLAAQLAKARERTHGAEVVVQRQIAQKTAVMGATALQQLPPESFLEVPNQKQRPTRAKMENNKLQTGAARLTTVNLQIKVHNPHQNRMTQTATDVRRTGASLRKFPSYGNLVNVSRTIVRCKTPRQRLIEAQRNFMSQRNSRCKSQLLASVFGTRNIPRIDPRDTPEQIIAKRREYWRTKKREQRAKLSMEVKARLKERDSLMRRVKRYQSILEEMRKARALAQAAGSSLSHASETIGGFIKEDGTVTSKIPHCPLDHNTAIQKSDEEFHVCSSNNSLTRRHHQSHKKQRGVAPVRVNQPPAPLCHAQVKVPFHPSRQSHMSVRLRNQLESTTAPNSQSSQIQAVGQLRLTHPRTAQNAISEGSKSGGCVMKMAVSSGAASLPTLPLDSELTEEEKMAKKREYWRMKKREQRAARAVRLKQGVSQTRANVALQRRRAHKQQQAVTSVSLTRRLTNNSVPVSPNANEIKQENESVPAGDLNSQPEQTICPDITHPGSPPPPSAPQPESDPALSADSQATTLLAVASMKKLLEESLSTVTECGSEQPGIKTETTEEVLDQEIKPNIPQLFFEKEEVPPLAADLTLQIKSWQPDTEALVQAGSLSPHLKDSPQISETPPPIPACSELVLHPTCDHSSQTVSSFIINPSMEVSYGPSSPLRTQRLCTEKMHHQNSTDPPKLHHLPMDPIPSPKHVEDQIQPQEQGQNSKSPSAQRYPSVGPELGGLTGLQRKREYWKLMKRQQRARLKARKKERRGESCSQLSTTDVQTPGLLIINPVQSVNCQAKPSIQPKLPIASLTVTTLPVVPAVNPTTHQSSVTLPRVSSSPRSEQNNIDFGLSHIMSDCLGTSENQQQALTHCQKWMSSCTDEDSVPSLPALKPPDNPLSSINLDPIEPPGQTSDSVLSPIKIPSQLQNPTYMIQTPSNIVPISTMVPPKPIPGEPEEDFLRRKREYWRIKKKEQRARKAIQVKGVTPSSSSINWRPILPAQEPPTQGVITNCDPDCAKSETSGQWVSSSDESEHLMSTSADNDTGSFPYSNYTATLDDDSELLFADYENNSGEEGSVSDAVWRNRYLMDYDPLNQLLVCIVCGELQYSHSLEGVRAHIDDAHPDTLLLESRERQRILEVWDEQVSQRERFFTSQLQQHSGSLAETHGN